MEKAQFFNTSTFTALNNDDNGKTNKFQQKTRPILQAKCFLTLHLFVVMTFSVTKSSYWQKKLTKEQLKLNY